MGGAANVAVAVYGPEPRKDPRCTTRHQSIGDAAAAITPTARSRVSPASAALVRESTRVPKNTTGSLYVPRTARCRWSSSGARPRDHRRRGSRRPPCAVLVQVSPRSTVFMLACPLLNGTSPHQPHSGPGSPMRERRSAAGDGKRDRNELLVLAVRARHGRRECC